VSAAGVELLVDVRRYPGSRRHPHFARDEMGVWLPERGVAYRWLPSLGGRRPAVAGSANIALRNEQFRGYADHMASAEFQGGVEELLTIEDASCRVAVMCAEGLWWHCHRRLLADHLVLVARVPVEHLFHDGRVVQHAPAPEARRVDGHVVYDVTSQGQLFGHLEPE
jgi:uncharacterized protein (DUF488 family)